MSEPNPTGSYPSPSMQQYASNGQQHPEAYQASPPTANMSQPPVLPPIQHLDGQAPPQVQQPPPPQQQQPQYYAPPPINGAQMQHPHPPPPPPNPYAYPENTMPPGPMPPNGTPNGHAAMRYPLPPQSMDARQMSGGRHKKEIKRRTKTGCLTCRKRRIKCDEGHPTCRNCQKSKRECLGYDPIFKSQNAPAPIQPAPGTLHSPPKAEPSSSHAGQMPPQYTQAPQGYAPAVSAGFPPGPPPNAPIDPSYEYGAALDPALSAEQVAGHMGPGMATYTTTLHAERKLKFIAIDDLFTLNGAVPNFPSPHEHSEPVSPPEMEEVRAMYRAEYAPALDKWFETTWYTRSGEAILDGHNEISHYFKHCVDRFRKHTDRPEETVVLPSLEARLIWKLAELPRSVAPQDPFRDVQTLQQRLDIVEDILTGQFLEEQKIPAAPGQDPHKISYSQDQWFADSFWHQLGRFLSIRDDTLDADNAANLSDTMTGMRNILSMLENRDVLYSMAIARHYGGRMAEYHPDKTLVATSNDPEDPLNKLRIAMGFLANQEGAGTTQVVQRFCGMVRRSWELLRSDHVTHPGPPGPAA